MVGFTLETGALWTVIAVPLTITKSVVDRFGYQILNSQVCVLQSEFYGLGRLKGARFRSVPQI